MTPSRKSKPSPAFVRIKREVIELTRQIPPGRVATYAQMGALLEVMPRHVAYILATLSPAEAEEVPWHRTVSANGKLLSPAGHGRGHRQAEKLHREGVSVDGRGKVQNLPHVQFFLS